MFSAVYRKSKKLLTREFKSTERTIPMIYMEELCVGIGK